MSVTSSVGYIYKQMQGSKDDVGIDQNITYSLQSNTFNKPLRIYNTSQHIYVFKIKTNQRSVVSMQVTHDFIKPDSFKDIVIKLAEKPSETTPLKLEINYAIPSEEELRINDSKMASYGRDAIFRKVITIQRDDSAKPSTGLEKSKQFSSKLQEINTLNLSAISLTDSKIQEIRIQPKIQEKICIQEAVKQQTRREIKVQEKAIEKAVQQTYPDLHYQPTQVKSQQINVDSGLSQVIDITANIQAPVSSPVAVAAYQVSINQGKRFADLIKEEEIPQIVIPDEKIEDFTYAQSSPIHKKKPLAEESNSKIKQSNNTDSLQQIGFKILREKAAVTLLREQQSRLLKGNSVYPIPIIFAIIFAAFFIGSTLGWIIS